MNLATITKEAVRTRIPWADITSCDSQDLSDGNKQVTITLKCPAPDTTVSPALEECFTGLGYIDVNVFCRALDKEDEGAEKWEFEVFGTHPRRRIWRPSSDDSQVLEEESTQDVDDKLIDMKAGAVYAGLSQAVAEQSAHAAAWPADQFVVAPEKDMFITHVIQNRSYLQAERWLFTNRIPMGVYESRDNEDNECIDHIFRTDEGLQLIMREDNNDTMSFFLNLPVGETETVEPNSITERFCSFVPMKDGKATGATVFITRTDLKSQHPGGETPDEQAAADAPEFVITKEGPL